jgi:hypothetical protein
VRVPAIALACAWLLGCSCPSTSILLDDFEGCSGTCGWAVSGPGNAMVVSTILAGEHGLEMNGAITATKSVKPTTIDNTYSLELVGNCPSGLAATLTATVPGTGDASLMLMLAIDNSLDTNGNPPDYSGASYVPLVGAITLPSGVMSGTVHEVALQPTAGSPCTIDLLRLGAAVPCQ